MLDVDCAKTWAITKVMAPIGPAPVRKNFMKTERLTEPSLLCSSSCNSGLNTICKQIPDCVCSDMFFLINIPCSSQYENKSPLQMAHLHKFSMEIDILSMVILLYKWIALISLDPHGSKAMGSNIESVSVMQVTEVPLCTFQWVWSSVNF